MPRRASQRVSSFMRELGSVEIAGARSQAKREAMRSLQQRDGRDACSQLCEAAHPPAARRLHQTWTKAGAMRRLMPSGSVREVSALFAERENVASANPSAPAG